MILLATLLIALQFADMWSTQALLKRGGRELNPIVRKLIAKVGFIGTTAIKVAVVVAIIWLSWPDGFWELLVACAVYAVIVFNNVRLLRKSSSRS